MSKYSGLSQIIRSHVNEEVNNGGSGWGPFWFFVILITVTIASMYMTSK